MTKEQFIEKCKGLELKGYIKTFKYDGPIKGDGIDYLYKVIEYAEDKYGDMRAINQLLLKVWHFEAFADRVPAESMYSIEPVVMFSRNSDERVDLHIHFPEHSIEYLEEKAKEFGEWCKLNMKI